MADAPLVELRATSRTADSIVASAHGPVLRGGSIHRAFDRVRALAGQPIVPPPGQETLDALVAQSLATTSA